MDVRSPGEGREAVHGPADVHSCTAFRQAGEAVSDEKGLPARAARRLKPRPRLVTCKNRCWWNVTRDVSEKREREEGQRTLAQGIRQPRKTCCTPDLTGTPAVKPQIFWTGSAQ
eukprot:3376938-Rhodomonas_salina.1